MRYAVLIGILIGSIAGTERLASAQVPRQNRFFNEREPIETGAAKIDRGVAQAMNKAQLAIKQKEFVQAVTLLQTVLDHPEDYFIFQDFDPRGIVLPSVKPQTHRILARLPEAGRAAYELNFGPTARSLLNEAVIADDMEKVADVVIRFQTTAAGLEAMQILSAWLYDHDELLETALICEEMAVHPRVTQEQSGQLILRTAFIWHLLGNTQKTIEKLDALQASSIPSAWRIGGLKIEPYREGDDLPSWILTHFGPPPIQTARTVTEWALPRGGNTGNESGAPAYPAGEQAWSISPLKYIRFPVDGESNQRLIDSLDRLTRQNNRALKEVNRITIPAAMPLVIDELMVYRTVNDIVAVNLKTGQLAWRSSTTDGTLAWMLQSGMFESDKVTATPLSVQGYLVHKLFRDRLSGSLTSDGHCIYAIEGSDSQFNVLHHPPGRRFLETISQPTNRLVAYDLKTGRISWEAGGISGTQPVDLSGIFFLGPPLAYDGRLLALAEVKDELCLIAMLPGAESVRLEWAQALITIGGPEQIGSLRRQVGLLPSISDRIIVCPTSNSSVVAMDLVLRKLLWGYSYDSSRIQNFNEGFALTFPSDDDSGRWLDSTPVLAVGHAIVTPRDSNEIHCLNLVDGKLAWKRPRGQGLYVACVNDDEVIVIGRNQVIALSIEDGSDVWPAPVDVPEVSGRGVRIESKYLLPLASGEIATVDLRTGRLLGRSKLTDERIPGNLVIGSNTLVSRGINDIIGFPSIMEIEREIARLIESHNDAEALALRGERRLHEGLFNEAIKDLRNSLRFKSNSKVKQLLAEILLTQAKSDPKTLLETVEELEFVTDDPEQKTEFLRLYSKALKESGDLVGATRQLFRLIETPELIDADHVNRPGTFVSIKQNIRSQLLTIYQSADSNQRIQLAQTFSDAFDVALRSENRDRATRFVDLVQRHPAAVSLLRKYLESNQFGGDDRLRIRLLERIAQSNDKTLAGVAVASLARHWLERNFPREARPWIEQLGRDFPSELCLDGKTGRELCDSWINRDDVKQSKEPGIDWMSRSYDVTRYPVEVPSHWVSIDFVTQSGHQFQGWTFELDQIDGVLSARDPSLRVAWQLTNPMFFEFSQTLPCQLHICGRKLAFYQGGSLLVMESEDSYSVPHVLLEKPLRSNLTVEGRTNDFRMERHLLPTGKRFPLDPPNPSTFLIGLNEEAVFYQFDNRLHALDSESGEVLWSRTGAAFGKSDGFVDKLLVLHSTNNDAYLLRPLDGEILQQHKGSKVETPIWYHDTRRMSHRIEETKQLIIEMRDFDGDKIVWQNQYPEGSRISVINDEEFAVAQPNGQMIIARLSSGETTTTAKLQEGLGGELSVQHYQDRYIVIAAASLRASHVTAFRSDNAFRVDGWACAVDQDDGRLVWSVPLNHLAFDCTQPSNWPVLVLASRESKNQRFGRPGSKMSVLILDKRTGKVVYETEENCPEHCRGARLIPMPEERKLIVDFQAWNLELKFSDDAK